MSSSRYAQLIDEYDEVFVQKAAAHADELEKAAAVLKESFKDTKLEAENPLKASHAYEEIAAGLKNATKAAEGAVVSKTDVQTASGLDVNKVQPFSDRCRRRLC